MALIFYCKICPDYVQFEVMHKRIQTHLLIGVMILSLVSGFAYSTGIGVGASDKVFAQNDSPCADDEVELSVPVGGNECVPRSGAGDDVSDSRIVTYLRWIINFAAGGVGVVSVIMIAIGGVQYITANANPQAIQTAKKKIFNAIIALVLFILMYAILNFLVPGGLIGV